MKTNLLEGILRWDSTCRKDHPRYQKQWWRAYRCRQPMGNLWTWEPLTAKHEGTEDQIKKSRFITHYDLLPLFPEGYIAANENPTNPWFTYVPGGLMKECNTTPIPVSLTWIT